MKHKGCILQFTDKRNNELMRAYRAALSSSDFIDMSKVSEMIVNTPCSQFWVSEERAMAVISSMLKGSNILDTMRPLKREMFEEIFDIVSRLRDENPDSPLFDIVMEAVHTPSPKFYMQPRCAMEIIYKIKKGFYEKQTRH